MPFYHRMGSIPSKRHIAFYKEDQTLHREELFSTKGFSGIYSNKYHLYMPTAITKIDKISKPKDETWVEAPLEWRLFHTFDQQKDGDPISSRIKYLFNATCAISTAAPKISCKGFYKNAYAHELIFVHKGSGVCKTEFGRIDFTPGDYIVIPKGVIYQVDVNEGENRMLVVESATAFDIPKHFRNEYGQCTESAPYCERDFRPPSQLETFDNKGEFVVYVKAGEDWYTHTMQHHPFDIVGWDGCEYPFAFNIHEYAPIVGQIHQPPPVHLVFTTRDFVVCNFVPRLFDFHPQSIPAPYFHSNVDSDEVLYYVEGNFMSRKGIKEGSISHHPMGLPHGPQPGKTEESIGKKETNECAVMIDTFAPLQSTLAVEQTMVSHYASSWLEKG
ncbi:MAG: homogentisate 1,2-dioxygenase [Deltaproteobacteria bacterium]|nr:homogentisate 1,2-dioxygenase [Deltaproteobacteria bacterium]